MRWTKDGDAVNTANPRITVSFIGNTSSLIIVSVIQADQGLYRCEANNSINTATSYSGSLTVHCEYLNVFLSLDTHLISVLNLLVLYISCLYVNLEQPGWCLFHAYFIKNSV